MAVVEERDAIILDLDWHPRGQLLAVVGSDGDLKVWHIDPPSPTLIFQKNRERSVRRCEWSPSGNFLATAGFDGKCIVYAFHPDASPKFSVRKRFEGHENEVKSCSWSPNEHYLATASRDRSIWVWNVQEDRRDFDDDCVAVHRGHTADVKHVVFSPDGALLASASFDGTVRIWDATTENAAIQVLSNHRGTVWTLAFSGETADLVSVGEDGKVILYQKVEDLYVYKREIELQKYLDPLYSVVFCDGGWLVAGSDRVLFWLDEGVTKVERSVKSPQIGDVNCAVPCPTNHALIALGSDDGTVVLLNTAL
jgi:WD40 repeat protein